LAGAYVEVIGHLEAGCSLVAFDGKGKVTAS
jgi:hypothetical protein